MAFQPHPWPFIIGRKQPHAAFFECLDQQILGGPMQAMPVTLEILDRRTRYTGQACQLCLRPIEQSARRAALLGKEIHSIKALPKQS